MNEHDKPVPHHCPDCGTLLGDVMKPEITAAAEQHYDTCPARPLAPGDYVRYDSPVPTTVPIWAEGEVIGPAKKAEHAAWGWLDVRVTAACKALQDRVGGEHAFGPPALLRAKLSASPRRPQSHHLLRARRQ